MAEMRYRLSNRATEDVDEIANYLVVKSPTAARRVVLELKTTFKALAANPELGSLCDDLKAGIRQFVPSRPANKFIMFYYVRSDGVEISDVIHSSRDWQSMCDSGER
jgi:plasmid stabilization system protein ParE